MSSRQDWEIRAASGNIMLETVLFLPLAFMVLFSVVDIGSSYWRRTRLMHVVREATREIQLIANVDSESGALFEIDESGQFQRGASEAEQTFLRKFSTLLETHLPRELIENRVVDSRPGWTIEAAIVAVEFSEDSGELKEILPPRSVLVVKQNRGAEFRSFNSSVSNSLEKIVDKNFRPQGAEQRFRHTLLIKAPKYFPNEISSHGSRYQGWRAYFVISIGGNMSGFGSAMFSQSFPGIYRLDDEIVENMRAYLN